MGTIFLSTKKPDWGKPAELFGQLPGVAHNLIHTYD